MNTLRSVRDDFKRIPKIVKYLCFNIFLFMFGWALGADMFFSIYIKSIVHNVLLVSLLAALLSLIRLAFSIPIGYLDKKINLKAMFIFGKALYIIVGVLYFLAGYLHMPALLIIGILINGLASPVVFNTALNIIRKYTSSENTTQSFGLFQTGVQVSYLAGSLIVSILVSYVDIQFFYLAISIFAIISIIITSKIKYPKKEKIMHEINELIFHKDVFKIVIKHLKNYDISLYIVLSLQNIFGLISYIGLLFIPLLGASLNLSFSEIAIIFAIMRIPYILSFLFGSIFAKKNGYSVIIILLFILAALVLGLGLIDGFVGLMILGFFISMGLAILWPLLSGLTSAIVKEKDEYEITGVQEFFTRSGEIVGALAFGLIGARFGFDPAFISIGCLVLLVAIATVLLKKRFSIPQESVGEVIEEKLENIAEKLEQ